ncbi:FAD-binding oxidoreductase [Sphingomonas sp. NY01]|uniref:NAD(P)/FAD-dependent oxidoreductase n=1 Tax=Sphingomonas sp. NY01 TaxID=2968057 RepID=UPI00315D162B
MRNHSVEAPRTILVIGGGVIGLSCALALQRLGSAVTLIEASSEARAASWGNAGHIATEQTEPIASPRMVRTAAKRLFLRGGALALPPGQIAHWLPFALRLARAASPARFARGRTALSGLLAEAMPAWRRYVDVIGTPDLLREDGHIVVWETPETAAAGLAAWRAADIGTTRFAPLDGSELDALRQRIAAPLAGGIRFTGSGQVADPGRLARTARAAFLSAGGSERIATVTAVDAASATLADGTRLTADRVVLAAGTGSAALLRPHGLKVPIIAERGYHLQSPPGVDWPADLPPVVFEDRSMIVTRFESGLRAASFVEFAGVSAAPDPRKWARLHRHAAALGLPMTGAQPWMGARPTLPDYLPAIGTAAGILCAFGHNHLGLTLAPITAEAIAALAMGETPPVDLSRFTPDRFSRGL